MSNTLLAIFAVLVGLALIAGMRIGGQKKEGADSSSPAKGKTAQATPGKSDWRKGGAWRTVLGGFTVCHFAGP